MDRAVPLAWSMAERFEALLETLAIDWEQAA